MTKNVNFNIVLIISVFCLILLGCNSIKYIEDYKGAPLQTLYSKEGVASSFETYVSPPGELPLYSEGPNVYFWENGKVKWFGLQKSVLLDSNENMLYLSKYDRAYPVKVGDWYYFNEEGIVDSIVHYKKFLERTWRVVTSVDHDLNIKFTDSVPVDIYKKKIIYIRVEE